MWGDTPDKIRARGRRKRSVLTVLLVGLTAGCSMLQREQHQPATAEATPTSQTSIDNSSQSRKGDTAGVPSDESSRIHTVFGTGGELERDRLGDNQLQRRDWTIEGRSETIERQLDSIDMRRRNRQELDPSRRNRPGAREVLLKQEQRSLEFERQSVQRQMDRLEFQRRAERAPGEPFSGGLRSPSGRLH